jgi:hypothetical protein
MSVKIYVNYYLHEGITVEEANAFVPFNPLFPFFGTH